jgi:hypothetical protein
MDEDGRGGLIEYSANLIRRIGFCFRLCANYFSSELNSRTCHALLSPFWRNVAYMHAWNEVRLNITLDP